MNARLRVLVVEDDNLKFGKILRVLTQHGIDESDIARCTNVRDAMASLQKERWDLLLLDINLPRRGDEDARRGGGLEVLHELERDDSCFKPRYIVGLTAYTDVVAEFGPVFDDKLWSLVQYAENSDRWIAQLSAKLSYISAAKGSEHFSDGVTFGVDLAIIAALEGVEFAAVQNLPFGWTPLRLRHDDTRYQTGEFLVGGRNASVVAAAAPRMGMPAAAVLSAKMIHQFRPRLLVMVGICAGRAERVQIGDVIVASPTWDWGSGKIKSQKNKPVFLPSPHQIDLDPDLLSRLKDVGDNGAALREIALDAPAPRPPTDIQVHFGPLVSGAAVVADKPTFDQLLAQHRGILGLDMEAYAVAAAALGSARPRPQVLVIKGVCDYADEDKDDRFQSYAAHVAAGVMRHAALALL